MTLAQSNVLDPMDMLVRETTHDIELGAFRIAPRWLIFMLKNFKCFGTEDSIGPIAKTKTNPFPCNPKIGKRMKT
jgi:hypothetical protein